MNWTRDRVRRLTRISESAAALSSELQALIHELGAEDAGKEQLTSANEFLHQAELEIHETLERAGTIWQLTAALAESMTENVHEDPEVCARAGQRIVFGETVFTDHPDSCHCGYCRDADDKQWPVMSTVVSIR